MNMCLIIGATLSAIVAILHIGCIAFGAKWYRFFGAGERMAELAEQGSLRPTLITSIIVISLATFSLYALSGAGFINKMPFLRVGLCFITFVYIFRGIVGLYFVTNPLGRPPQFWWWSSSICLAFGLIHLYGLKETWSGL
jgi:hypothetical protein